MLKCADIFVKFSKVERMQLQVKDIIERLKSAQNKQELNATMLFIRALAPESQQQLKKKECAEIVTLIRTKILEDIYQKGDIPDRDILWSYGIFKRLEELGGLEKDERFETYIQLGESYVRNPENSYYERLLFIECASVAKLLCGKCDEAVKFMISQTLYLDLHDTYAVELDKFLNAFCTYYEIPIEWILEIQREELCSEYYASVNDKMKKSVFLWSMHVFWNIPRYFNNLKWKENFPTWLEVLERLLKEGNLDLAMYVSFYIYHKFGNSALTQEDWQEYNDKVVKLIEPYLVEYGKTLPKCKEKVDSSKNRKIKVAFLHERMVENSPYKVEYSLCKALLENEEFSSRYEILVLSMNYIQKSADDMKVMQSFCEIGATVMSPAYGLVNEHLYYVSHLQKALMIRNTLLAEGVDILICGSTTDCAAFMMATRSAPLQIFYSHGNGRYDVAGIDRRISHCAVMSPYKFESFAVPMDEERFYNPPRPKEAIEAERAKYPIDEDTVVLGVIGRLVKVDSEDYLKCIAEVMHKHKNTIFIAAGNGNIPVIRQKVEELGISERFFMPGFVDPHIYGHIIDIFCNTFPLEQGESLSEFFHKGKSYITYYDVYQKKFSEANFCEESRLLKFRQDNYLVYIRNAEKYQEGLKNLDKITEIPGIVFLYGIQEKGAFEKISCKCEKKCVEKPEILADFQLEIKNDRVCMVGANTTLVPKKPFPFLQFYDDVEIYKDFYSVFMIEHQDMFWKDGDMLYRGLYGRTVEDYVERLSYQIQHKETREQIGRALVTQMRELYRAKQSLLIAKMREFFND